MINESFLKAIRGKGKLILGITLIGDSIYYLINLILQNISLVDVAQRNGSGLMKVSIMYLILTLVGFMISLIITPGLIGSWDDLMKDKEVSVKTYFLNSKQLILRYIGFAILLGIPLYISSYMIRAFYGLSLTDLSAISNYPYLATSALVNLILSSITFPLLVLFVLNYEGKLAFLKENYYKILVTCFIVQALGLIPVIGILLALAINMFLIALIVSWYHQWNGVNVN